MRDSVENDEFTAVVERHAAAAKRAGVLHLDRSAADDPVAGEAAIGSGELENAGPALRQLARALDLARGQEKFSRIYFPGNTRPVM